MDASPPCKFYIVDETNQARFPFSAYFFPRTGDFINIGGICLKVVGVIINAAQSGGAGIHGNVNVYVEKTASPFSDQHCDEHDLVEYCEHVRDRLP